MTAVHWFVGRRVGLNAWRLIILIGAVLSVLCRQAFGQGAREVLHFERGETTEDVVSGSDPAERYAVYLPSHFQDDGTAPVAFLMDPRGRAMVPLELFRDAAEQQGFVLISSYNTLSDADTAFAANDRALSAMLIDAQARFSVNPRRFYLVGFSGTAHYAWAIAPQLDGYLAGIMGVGGGLPAYSDPIRKALAMKHPFVFFAAAGMGDFNLDGVRYLDRSLDSTGVAHRLVTHEGEHAWPPKPIARDAVEWFSLQAMRTGQRDVDHTFVDRVKEKYMLEASALEASGRKADAYRRYREITQDFEGLGGAAKAEERYATLGDDPSVGREFRRRAEIAQRVLEYKLKVRDFYLDYRKAAKLPTTKAALNKLSVEKLRKQLASDDREEAGAARRMLATAFVNTAFYEPRDYFARRDYRRAAGMLRIAGDIEPGRPRVCYRLAEAEAQLGEIEEALEALECGLRADRIARDLLLRDELLEPLRDDPRFKSLVDSTLVD